MGGGEWGWGLEEPGIRLSFRVADEINNCHFEPKARNLKFPFPPVLRERALRGRASALRGRGRAEM